MSAIFTPLNETSDNDKGEATNLINFKKIWTKSFDENDPSQSQLKKLRPILKSIIRDPSQQ